jgi:hypothetical protein
MLFKRDELSEGNTNAPSTQPHTVLTHQNSDSFKLTSSLMSYPLYICTYDRGKDSSGGTKPYHWSFFIATDSGNKNKGIAHQLRGGKGFFRYKGAEDVSDLTKTTLNALKDRLEIGAIPAASVGSVHGLLKDVEIVQDETSEWNCQSWAEVAFEVMKAKGWVWASIDAVKSKLKED